YKRQALKDVISNLVAGLLILFYRPFRKGDWIEVSGLRGEVVDIDLRYIRLRGAERSYLVPNSMFFNSAVTLVEKPAADVFPPSPAGEGKKQKQS
ncbi:MAG: mechanosensitive ion channel family protein, partial [Planctomycetota bacterium]|nr:mechanosensitive ion channel family protein [Planctomycetota bacterium]